MTRSDRPIRFDYTKTGNQLAELARGPTVVGIPGAVIQGLTTAEFRFDVEMEFQHTRLPNGMICTEIAGAAAEIGYPEMTVYVDRKYVRGSCEFQVTLDHENQHVAINRRVADKHRQRIVDVLRNAALSKAFPVISASSQEGAVMARLLLQAAYMPAIEALGAECTRENAAIDTPQSYAQARRRCRNW